MANKKISQLTDGSPAQATDQIPVNRAGANFRVNAGTIPPAGADTQVQFNDGGAAAGDAGMVFAKATGRLSISQLLISTPDVPANAGAAGVAGEIAWDAGFIYICVAANTWKRVAIATW